MSGRMLMATVATLALAMPAVAQDEAVPLDTEQSASPETEQAPTMTEDTPAGEAADQQMAEEAMPPPDMEFLQVQEETQILASNEVIGVGVRNITDEEVGTVADLVFDQDHKLTGIVMSVGGFLGIGEKWVAVPLEQIDLPTGDQPARLQAAVTEEQLKNAPDFTTRAAIEAEQAAAEAQRQAMEQQQQLPSPTTGAQ